MFNPLRIFKKNHGKDSSRQGNRDHGRHGTYVRSLKAGPGAMVNIPFMAEKLELNERQALSHFLWGANLLQGPTNRYGGWQTAGLKQQGSIFP